jgi:hypothetical protein
MILIVWLWCQKIIHKYVYILWWIVEPSYGEEILDLFFLLPLEKGWNKIPLDECEQELKVRQTYSVILKQLELRYERCSASDQNAMKEIFIL